MKVTVCYFLLMIIATVCGSVSFNASAQGFGVDKIESSVNPFPLSEQKQKLLLRNADKTIVFYRKKYENSDLSTWKESDRNAYLIAKSRRVVLLIMPVYYRTYPSQEPTIVREIADTRIRAHYAGQVLYSVTFYANPEHEDITNMDDKLCSVKILEENGEACSVMSATTGMGFLLSPLKWEDDLYEKIQKGIVPKTRYYSGYELTDSITGKYIRDKKSKKIKQR